MVLCILTSRMVIFETQAFVLSLPRLPMLIPCPGPQFTLCTYMLEHPVCIEMQSSPANEHHDTTGQFTTFTLQLPIYIRFEICLVIPSVSFLVRFCDLDFGIWLSGIYFTCRCPTAIHLKQEN